MNSGVCQQKNEKKPQISPPKSKFFHSGQGKAQISAFWATPEQYAPVNP
jgi:hypothetical protein